MVDKGRLRRSWRDGGVSATRYERACPDAVKSSRDEDIKMHVDYWHGEDGVDVKGNNLPDEIWVEFKNVRGDAGWLLGKAKWIAFEMCEVGGYVRVEREELLDWCKKNVDFSKRVWKKDAYRKIYQRKDRQDQITLLALHDLRELNSYEVIPYRDWYIDPQSLDKKDI